MEYSESRGRYLIVAGPYNDAGHVALFSWSGKASDGPELIPDATFEGLSPEAMFIYPGNLKAVQFLSDDSAWKIGAVSCKEMTRAKQRFRGISLDIR